MFICNRIKSYWIDKRLMYCTVFCKKEKKGFNCYVQSHDHLEVKNWKNSIFCFEKEMSLYHLYYRASLNYRKTIPRSFSKESNYDPIQLLSCEGGRVKAIYLMCLLASHKVLKKNRIKEWMFLQLFTELCFNFDYAILMCIKIREIKK